MPHNADLTEHKYVWVRNEFILNDESKHDGLTPAVWFGVSSTPGRAMGCHVLLENGATVIDLPLNALCCEPAPATGVGIEECMGWDSFGWDIETYEPEYLSGLTVLMIDSDITGEAWFAVDWKKNGWSNYPEQHKWLWIIAGDDGNLYARPQNDLLFYAASFTESEHGRIPAGGIKRQRIAWKAER